ncbi:MAG: aminoglycoside phosphotransferase family protein [Acidobacteria bacterium]|nr:aminoglycoside phosphotransferase family protein [Acidobacteriota bacterium]
MSKHATIEILRTDLLAHPAVKVWSALQPERVEPECIEILRERKKSDIYRLKGVGLEGSAVIAKRCCTATALIERTIYKDILPHLPITTLHYYGFTQEDDQSCWLFLEDAGSARFSPYVEEQRTLAAHWLALMHISAARVAAATPLPDRGPRHYLEHLRSGRQVILQTLTNPTLKDDDAAVLRTIVAQYDFLESHWGQFERFADGMPSTLAHGDFRPKNIHIRTNHAGTSLLPMDWETAGWGIPAADLAPTRGLHPIYQLDITTYCSIVRECWPGFDIQTIHQLANVGRIFRRLAAIDWESKSFAFGWINIKTMKSYHAELCEAIKEATWMQ